MQFNNVRSPTDLLSFHSLSLSLPFSVSLSQYFYHICSHTKMSKNDCLHPAHSLSSNSIFYFVQLSIQHSFLMFHQIGIVPLLSDMSQIFQYPIRFFCFVAIRIYLEIFYHKLKINMQPTSIERKTVQYINGCVCFFFVLC